MKKAATAEMFNGPGVAPIQIKAIDKKAVEYVEVRDSRMALTKKECEARDALIAEVQAHATKIGVNAKGEVVYTFDDLKVIYKPGKPKITVRSADSPDDEGDDE
jgi:hypothetical protein